MSGNKLSALNHPATGEANPTAPQTEKTEPEQASAQASLASKYRLPNAKQNQAFELDLSTLDGFPETKSLRLVDAAETTLLLDGRLLTGLPAISGDCLLKLAGENVDGETVAIHLVLLVNPDPRTLWDNLEPETDLFRKPHCAYQRIDDDLVQLTAARVRGRSHAHKGSFCEDDFSIAVIDEALGYFGMVSDGAGSSKFSRLASKVLAEGMPRHLQKACAAVLAPEEKAKLNEQLNSGETAENNEALQVLGKLLGDAIVSAFSGLMEYVHLGDAFAMKDLYATCLVFWTIPLQGGRWALVAYWVGDGGLTVMHGDEMTLLGKPDSGEFSGQTRFLTEEEISESARATRIHTLLIDDLQSVWAMTDGITDAKFSSEKALADSEQWQALTQELMPHLANDSDTYKWLNFWSQGNHDDRAFAALTINTYTHAVNRGEDSE